MAQITASSIHGYSTTANTLLHAHYRGTEPLKLVVQCIQYLHDVLLLSPGVDIHSRCTHPTDSCQYSSRSRCSSPERQTYPFILHVHCDVGIEVHRSNGDSTDDAAYYTYCLGVSMVWQSTGMRCSVYRYQDMRSTSWTSSHYSMSFLLSDVVVTTATVCSTPSSIHSTTAYTSLLTASTSLQSSISTPHGVLQRVRRMSTPAVEIYVRRQEQYIMRGSNGY